MKRNITISPAIMVSVLIFVQGVMSQDNKGIKHYPIWNIFQNGTDQPVEWTDHAPNPRFAIYDPKTPDDVSDDVVFDKETGLLWARDANLPNIAKEWMNAIFFCRFYSLGSRKGWRLPTMEEMLSLSDITQMEPQLPQGHPFINVQDDYWTSTTYEFRSDHAWGVSIDIGATRTDPKKSTLHVWPVRGGNGYARASW